MSSLQFSDDTVTDTDCIKLHFPAGFTPFAISDILLVCLGVNFFHPQGVGHSPMSISPYATEPCHAASDSKVNTDPPNTTSWTKNALQYRHFRDELVKALLTYNYVHPPMKAKLHWRMDTTARDRHKSPVWITVWWLVDWPLIGGVDGWFPRVSFNTAVHVHQVFCECDGWKA